MSSVVCHLSSVVTYCISLSRLLPSGVIWSYLSRRQLTTTNERTSHETIRAIAFHVCSAVSSDATNETMLIRRVYKRLHTYFRDAAAPAKGYGRGGEIDEHKLMFGASNKTGLAASITSIGAVLDKALLLLD